MTDRLDKYSGPAIARRASLIPAQQDLDGAELTLRFKDVIARRWLTALIVLIVVVGGVAIGAQFREPVYRATGLIEIRSAPNDTPSVDALLASRRVSDEVLETEVGMLRSSALAGRVIEALNLASDPAFTRDTHRSKKANPGLRDALAERQALVDQLRTHLTIDPQQGRLVAVSFDAHDPSLAARVVNGVLDCYTSWRMEDTAATGKWLSKQIEEAQKQLQASELRLQAHVRRSGLQIIDTGQGESANLVNDRLRQLQSQLADIQVDRFQKQSEFENAAAPGRTTRTMDGPVIQSLTVRLADLQREYASLTTTFKDDYPKVQQVKEQIAQVQKSLDDEVRVGQEALRTNYQSAMRREALLIGALNSQQKTAQSLVGDMAGYESLKREVATNQQLYTTLDQKLKEVTIAAGLKATNLGVVDRASELAASSLNFPLAVTLGLASCVGLLLGLGLVFVQEHGDRSVRSVTQVDAHLGYPALAVIPAIGGRAIRPAGGNHLLLGTPAPAMEASKQASLSEAFAALRTSVMLNNNEPPPNSLLITSASAGEGKTTVAINLAVSLARLNERVLLIDFDLRRPSVHTAMGLAREPGLSNSLMGEADWRKCVQKGGVASLDVLAAGRNMADQSAELAMSPRLRKLLTEAEEEYDFVIIDSAPVLIYPADVRTLAALVDGTLLTVRSGHTSREAVREAWSQVRRPLGIVLNAASRRETPYGYGYGYAESAPTTPNAAD